MLHDERRLPELFFNQFFKIQHLQAGQRAGGQAGFFLAQAELFQGAGQPGGVVHICSRFGVFHNGFANRQAFKRRGQVHRLASVGQLQRTRHFLRHVPYQRLGVVHQVVVVPPGGVKLHHRELGVVPHADAFVAVAPVDLKNALEAANDQALQIKLGRNAQEHFLV